MKLAVLLGDGMADEPIASLGNRTPLEVAKTPNMDLIAQKGIFGLTRTVPEGMNPGSDTANLSVFGYDPKKYYTGRAPLEALNMGIEMAPGDVAFRCNIVNITDSIMQDFSGGHIESAYSKIIIEELAAASTFENIEFYPGVSYRHIVIWRDFPFDSVTDATPPHDITDREISEYLPKGDGAETLQKIMDLSGEVISSSEKIRDAGASFKGNPSSVWLWGGGTKPMVDTYQKRFGIRGYTISAVDLIHGIGRAAGLEPLPVEGATGYIDTNYTGKAGALCRALKETDFVYLHVESPDESGHEGNLNNKLKSIEDFDRLVVGPVWEEMQQYDDFAILVMPDHPTPINTKTHSSEPVPFALYRSRGFSSMKPGGDRAVYTEKAAMESGLFIEEAHRLIEIMQKGSL